MIVEKVFMTELMIEWLIEWMKDTKLNSLLNDSSREFKIRTEFEWHNIKGLNDTIQ
jgi:hypothetical protein